MEENHRFYQQGIGRCESVAVDGKSDCACDGFVPKKVIEKGVESVSFDGRSRRFILRRNEDETGISGTGDVAQGIEFYDGICAVHWNSPLKSTTVYESIRVVETLHGHGGKTQIVWIDFL